MSHTLVSRSHDLRRLQHDGYDIAVEGDHLLLRDVPFLDASGKVVRGTLVSELTTTGTTTAPNPPHTVYLVGGVPHNDRGTPLTDELICDPNPTQLRTDLHADCQAVAQAAQRISRLLREAGRLRRLPRSVGAESRSGRDRARLSPDAHRT